MKTPNGFGYTSIIADITDKGYCKIVLNDNGKIVKAYVGSSSADNYEVYCAHTPDSCWKHSMSEMLNLSLSCFIELFSELKLEEQIEYAKELAKNEAAHLLSRSEELITEAEVLVSYAAKLNSITN